MDVLLQRKFIPLQLNLKQRKNQPILLEEYFKSEKWQKNYISVLEKEETCGKLETAAV